ncbi:MAG: ABC transporter ATP-binding protein [Anaerobutyricum hallii]|nr:ABC transporter ATP-binding protein [Anaerobutyricum hallii]MBS7165278.1 ABC transporter ATP-binding protein [Anaerobutyricum hallii]MCO7154913.1 ABC transporter ATP-binding protein/permease [Anaerobutyricum hallii]HJH97895.1 ABC transporter ATP-binding protein/permease [Anaerobutyricum hallii]
MKKLLYFMKDYKKESVLAPLFKMLEAFFELFVPLVVASIIDDGIVPKDSGHIIRMCLLLLVLAAVGLTCSITAQYFAAKSAVGAATGIRYELFTHIQTLGYEEMDMVGTSTLITRMTSDINQVQNGINLVLRLFLRSPFIVFGAMIMAFTIDVKAAMIFVVAIILLSIVVFGVMFITKPLYKKVQSGLDTILGTTRENLTGVRVIRAFHQEQAEYNKFLAENEELTSLQKFAGKISGLTNPLTFIIINFAILVLIHTGAVRVSLGTLSQGQVVALYNYMSQILVELIKLANLIISVTKAMACFNRIQDVFHIEPSMKEGTKTVAAAGNTTPAVEFKNVSFTYAGGGDHAVENISFKAMPGQTIGIIGGTGSGKSTLVNLIPRFYDVSEGEVDIAGKNIQDYTYGSLRNTISVVPQKAQLFAGTIRDNLTFGCPDATEEQIEEALAISQAKEFVDTKEGRLDAKIEQGGKNLSGGQRQRLTLARALVPQSDILIMDDSASALDYATDARLRKAIQDMKRKPTVFIVSQRTSSIQNADMILVLDDGKIAGQGTHEQLLKSCNIYREIYETQFKKEEA